MFCFSRCAQAFRATVCPPVFEYFDRGRLLSASLSLSVVLTEWTVCNCLLSTAFGALWCVVTPDRRTREETLFGLTDGIVCNCVLSTTGVFCFDSRVRVLTLLLFKHNGNLMFFF